MMNLGDLLKPFMPLIQKATSVELDAKAAADFIYELLGDKERQKRLVQKGDAMIKGGVVIEAVDGPFIDVAFNQLRKKADELSAEQENEPNPS